MAHIHSVHDSDAHFSINPITRVLRNEASGKTSLIQYDHNSERFTFEIPRMVEGHDMSLCNHIRVHYINIDAKTKAQASGVYEVEDMRISPESDDVVICSWLISRNCTQLVGSLNFLIRFCCVTDGFVDYAWNTATYTGISVSSGIDADETFKDDYVDIIEQWKADVMRVFDDQVKQIADETKASMEAFSEEMKGDVTAWKEAESAGIHNDLVLMGSRVDELAAMRGQGDFYYDVITHEHIEDVTAMLYTNGLSVYMRLLAASSTIETRSEIHLSIPKKFRPIFAITVYEDEDISVEVKPDSQNDPDVPSIVITNKKAPQNITVTKTAFYAVYPLKDPAMGELVDMRVGYDGKIYESAGTAVREQIRNAYNIIAAPSRLSEVTIVPSAWVTSDVTNNLHSQVVTIDGITAYSKVDLLPSVEQLAIFHEKDVAFVTENEDGVVTVFAVGDKPTQEYTMQVQITEVAV